MTETVSLYVVPTLSPRIGSAVRGTSGDTSLHLYLPEGVRSCTRGKMVTARWPDAEESRVDLGFLSSAR